jgi:Flp pilus assembly protein protease CpaA
MTQARVGSQFFVRAYATLLPIAAGMLAFALAFPSVLRAPFSLVLVGISALGVWISLVDFRIHRVPNWITYPLMLAGVARALALVDATFLIYWAVLFSLWQVRFMGGGDAKLLMGFFGLFPDFQLAWVTAVSILITGIPYLVFKYRHQWRSIPRALFLRLITQQLLPSPTEFEKEAVPYAFSFCLACIAYLVLHVAPR